MEKNSRRIRGATFIEVALLIALIAVIAIPSLKVLGKKKACKDLAVGSVISGSEHGPQNLELLALRSQYGCQD